MIYDCCNENRKNAILNNPASIIAAPAISAAGSGYAVGDVLTIVQSGSSGSAMVTVSAANATGGVTGITLTSNGALYRTATGVAASGGKGAGCTLNLSCTPNGIDYLEVESPADPSQPPTTLKVYCLKSAPTNLTAANVLITGGESITSIAVASIDNDASEPNILYVTTKVAGDFSQYTLRLVNSSTEAASDPFTITETLDGFDPQLAEVNFTFRILCGQEFDCSQQTPACAPSLPTPPPINYLAKDYGSFRTLMLDRLNQLLPSWAATSEADLGIALAELIAYRADYLSYQQDAVATEAYLQTARSRISLRRHALLMDYHVHDGCNARGWIHLTVAGNPTDQIFMDRTITRFYSSAPEMPSLLAAPDGGESAVLSGEVQVFEPMQDAILHPDHNVMHFHTWGNANYCLPNGATEATLAGSHPALAVGDVLIFAEVLGPQTGVAADADLRHRCAVRLTQVATHDARGQLLADPLFDSLGNPAATPVPITEIQWSEEDKLPFALCISSSYLDSDTESIATAANVSVAYGNIVLADHGLSTSESIPQAVPAPQLFYPRSTATDGSQQSAPVPIPVRYRPTIANSPITQAVPMVLAGSPATPEVVMLGGAGAISLTDANGIPCLTVQALNPSGWPALFGISVKANQSTPGNFDLYVVYNPNGAAAGTPPPPVLEEFFNLSLTATDPNFAASVINTSSKLIQVPSTYVPPATALSGFPATIAMLPASGALHLQDTSNPAVTYLTLQPSSPSQWLNSIGVLAQAAQQASTSCCATVKPEFSLLVVYNPLAAGVNVNLPVILEQLTPPSQPTLPGVFSPGSQLITLQTYSQAPGQSLSAYALMNYDPRKAVPEICLCGTLNGATSAWLPQQDLLGSNGSSQVFVVETESDGAAMLRFATAADPGSAEETNGLVPEEGTSFTANYRIGNGVSGNVGAESLIYVTTGDARIQSCSNPLPAGGGVDPETSDQIRRRAPQAFLAQERSVTMADYEATMESSAEVNQAVASLRWTGSWYSVFAAVEPAGGGNLSCALKKQLAASGESYRLAGQDLILESPQYVSLQVTLQIQVAPDYFQADVEHSLLQVLGSKNLPNGSKGLFSAGNFTFGQTVYLSPVYAAARSVPGVVLVTATQFQPQGVTTSKYLTAGEIKLGSLQIARLENDPSYPDHGQLTLLMQGGK